MIDWKKEANRGRNVTELQSYTFRQNNLLDLGIWHPPKTRIMTGSFTIVSYFAHGTNVYDILPYPNPFENSNFVAPQSIAFHLVRDFVCVCVSMSVCRLKSFMFCAKIELTIKYIQICVVFFSVCLFEFAIAFIIRWRHEFYVKLCLLQAVPIKWTEWSKYSVCLCWTKDKSKAPNNVISSNDTNEKGKE